MKFQIENSKIQNSKKLKISFSNFYFAPLYFSTCAEKLNFPKLPCKNNWPSNLAVPADAAWTVHPSCEPTQRSQLMKGYPYTSPSVQIRTHLIFVAFFSTHVVDPKDQFWCFFEYHGISTLQMQVGLGGGYGAII